MHHSQINGVIVARSLDHLVRNVCRRAAERECAIGWANVLAKAKVDDANVALPVDKQILGLQVKGK